MSSGVHYTPAWRSAVMVMFAAGGVAVSTWGPRLPSIQASLRFGNGVIGILLAGAGVGSVVGLAVSSTLLFALGPRRALRLVLVLLALGIAMIGFGAGIAQSVVLAGLAFVLVGFAIGALDVMINVQGAAVERVRGKTLMPQFHAAWSVGAIIGSGLGAGAAALGISFQSQFIAEAILIAGVSVVSVGYIPSATGDTASSQTPAVGVRFRRWISGWSDRRLLLIGLAMLGVELGEGTSNSWLTLAVRHGHHQSDVVASLYFTAFAVGETLARAFGGRAVDRVGRVATVRITTAIGVVGVVIFILATPAPLVLIGTVLWSVGVSMGFPLGMSAAAESGPDPAARVSVVSSAGFIAALGGPPVIGFVSQSLGLLGALWIVVGFLVLAFLVSGVFRGPGPAENRRGVPRPVADST